ncbi:hypothetical protein [Spongiactinospora rosea]|uniref:hypothetical protein n=1 Tax=Spongiactinospora rosea TaxID=2248750 RepID=UPI0011C0496A|nr:hypothetical protein [Spongiactinospora rosea]
MRSKQHYRLYAIIDRLRKAEVAGQVDEVRTLYNECQFLLKELGSHASSYEKRQIGLTSRWLTAVPAGDSLAISPPTAPSGRLKAAAHGLSDYLSAILTKTARSQTTISLKDLAEQAGATERLCTGALIMIDKESGANGPMLSALVASPHGDARPDFRQVLAELNYEVPQTDIALNYVWRRELERAYAFHAEPPREMPARLVPRKKTP